MSDGGLVLSIIGGVIAIRVVFWVISIFSDEPPKEKEEYNSIYGGSNAAEDYIIQQNFFNDHHKH